MLDICSDFEGKLIKIDVIHGQSKNSGNTRGLLVENNEFYIVNDLGDREKL
jgi:hypothetical protein